MAPVQSKIPQLSWGSVALFPNLVGDLWRLFNQISKQLINQTTNQNHRRGGSAPPHPPMARPNLLIKATARTPSPKFRNASKFPNLVGDLGLQFNQNNQNKQTINQNNYLRNSSNHQSESSAGYPPGCGLNLLIKAKPLNPLAKFRELSRSIR